MAEPRIEETGHGSWMLVGDLSFTTVPALRGGLVIKSADRPRISIDLAGVTRSDSAGLALLIEWLRESERLGKTITFLHMPAQLQSIARICGLDGILPVEMAAPPPSPPAPATAPSTAQSPRQATPRRRNRKARR
jgi:phospholipid transport system transporter-binding protein